MSSAFPRLRTAVAGAILAAVAFTTVPPTPVAAAPVPDVPSVSDAYYEVLMRHTVWAEQQWDAAAGHYRFADFRFAVVLGNAVLITRDENYDPAITGVSRAVLLDHTVRTIAHFAASNRLAGGTQWGRTLFWDSTYESYLVLAAHLLWDQLDAGVRADIDAISAGQASYAAGLGTSNDPLSGGWTTNGLAGGYRGDTKLEEMGVFAQAIAPGVAWNADHPEAQQWREALSLWMRNETGLPVADRNNPATIDGVAVSENTAHNIHDTFTAENHGSFGPHYQSEVWRTAGRNAIHFLLAGEELPEAIMAQPNHEELLATILRTMSDAGEPLMPMVDDREFLYGRDVIPLAFLSQVQGNEYVARAEMNLASRLLAYQAYGDAPRIAKFTGEPKYEPEARAEIAISYLLHEWRAESGLEPVVPASDEEFFEYASGAVDYGTAGMLAHQSPSAWAGTITKPGYTKFAWQPGHDDWLMDVSGSTPSFLPSTATAADTQYTHAYTETRDGFDGTASLLSLPTGRAGMTTLPTGTVVYATSGTADSEGVMSVRNFDMGGIPGLDGTRTYETEAGAVEYAAADEGAVTVVPPKPANVARLDSVDLADTSARFIRIQGVQGAANGFGYSLFEFEVRETANGANVAAQGIATASSQDTGAARLATAVNDNSTTSRWAVASSERSRNDSWVQLDFGQPRPIANVMLYWEAAAARAYSVQVSDDGVTWREAAFRAPQTARIDTVNFAGTQARYVRMTGVQGSANGFGYSVFEFEVRNGAGANLATSRPTTASSAAQPATNATDGDWGTRWAVATAERPRADSWLSVDLGGLQTIDTVRLGWEAAAAQAYTIQTSADGVTWTTVSFQTPGVHRLDDLQFAPRDAKFVRMQGVLGDGGYGYSLWEMEVRNGVGGANLAAGAVVTASSEDAANGRQAIRAADGSYGSRWAVATTERQRGDSWLQFDLGSVQTVDRVRLSWESAAGALYRVQTSLDGVTWSDAASYGFDEHTLVHDDSDWLTVDGRVGFVVRNSTNPIAVLPGTRIDKIVLSSGSAEAATGMIVEGYAQADATRSQALARQPGVDSSDPAVVASDADDYLSVFNLSNSDVTATLGVPDSTQTRYLYQGGQVLDAAGSVLTVMMPAATSAILAPRFGIVGVDGSTALGVEALVVDGTRLLLRGDVAGDVVVTQLGTGQVRTVSLVAGEQQEIVFDSGRPLPVADAATDRTTFPTSPLPAGMSDPDLATDDDACTAWEPGGDDRSIAVDLGKSVELGSVGLLWSEGTVPSGTLAVSDDGLAYREVGATAGDRLSVAEATGSARYVLLTVSEWQASEHASLERFSVYPSSVPREVIDRELVPCGDAISQLELGLEAWDEESQSWLPVGDEVLTAQADSSQRLRVELRNVGTTALDVTLSTSLGVLDDCELGAIPAAESRTCELQVQVVRGNATVEISAEGTDPWARTVEATTAASILGWYEALSVAVEVRDPATGAWTSPSSAPGLGIPRSHAGPLEIRYTVVNTGDRPFRDVGLAATGASVDCNPAATLAAGDRVTCSGTLLLADGSAVVSAVATATTEDDELITARSGSVFVHRSAAPPPPIVPPIGPAAPGHPIQLLAETGMPAPADSNWESRTWRDEPGSDRGDGRPSGAGVGRLDDVSGTVAAHTGPWLALVAAALVLGTLMLLVASARRGARSR